ncbi:MAG: hypothetical protein EBS48_08095, partial [Actinobacteria bacterium]|nr:hypothetical protein [Actinomycetota bacterium]
SANSPLDLTRELTFEAWINPTTKNSAPRNLIAKENAYLISIFASNDQWNPNRLCWAFRGAGWSWQCSNTTITMSTWTHLAVTKSGTQVFVYLNGVLSTTTTLDSNNSGSIATNDNPVGIGNRPAVNTETYTGNIDELRLWNYARSAAEIADNYQRRLSGNVLHLPVDSADAAFSTVSGTNTVLNRAARSGGGFNAVLGSGANLTTSSTASADLNLTGGSLRGFLPGVDTASSGASLRFSISTQGAKGTVTVNPLSGEFTYVPNRDATGSDSFTYTLTGASGTTTSALSVTLPDTGLASSRSFLQTADVTATVGVATSLGYTSPVSAFTNGETVRATLSSTSGNLAVTLNGSTISGGAQNSTSLSIDGTQSQVNAALNSATITSSAVAPSRVTLTVSMAPTNQTFGGRTWTYNSNGHYYAVLDSGGSFTQPTAVTNARSITVGGRRAYLATIQHSGENTTVRDLVPANNAAWIGGSDSATEGTYRWAGNDAYGIFRSAGAAFRNRYNNFSANEPNDSGGNEDWIEIGNSGTWNDCGPGCSRRYAIMEVDPVSTRSVTNIDFARPLTATLGAARNLQLGSTFLGTSLWGTNETVTATFTASAGTVAYTQGSTTVTAGSSGSSTVTFEGGRDAMNTALNTVTVNPPSTGSSTVTMTFGVKRQTSGSYLYLPATDHFYLRNATTALRDTHVTTASSTGFGGTTGYLATVTSGEEYAAVKSISTTSAHSGATDSVSEGQFSWDAPDAYEIFSDYDQPLPGSYSSFHPAWVDNSGESLVLTFEGGEYWDDQPLAANPLAAIYEWTPIDTLLTFNVTTSTALGVTTPASGLTTTLGSAYSLNGASGVTGGLSPYTYSLSGALPAGLSLNTSTGTISGTPTVAGGSYPVTLTVTDSNGATASTSSFSISRPKYSSDARLRGKDSMRAEMRLNRSIFSG